LVRPSALRDRPGLRRVAAGTAIVALLGILAAGDNPGAFTGGGTWQSLLLAATESVIVVGVSVAVLQLFGQRYNRQGRLLRAMSRAAYGAFLIHPPVLVGLILALRHLQVPTEARYLLATGLAVAGSYALAAALVRLPASARGRASAPQPLGASSPRPVLTCKLWLIWSQGPRLTAHPAADGCSRCVVGRSAQVFDECGACRRPLARGHRIYLTHRCHTLGRTHHCSARHHT
jgi:peptidoglycan/LPS O-acetylase OafA/YrhL